MTWLAGEGRIGTIFSTQEDAQAYADGDHGCVVLRFLGWSPENPWPEPGFVVADVAGLRCLGSYPMIEAL